MDLAKDRFWHNLALLLGGTFGDWRPKPLVTFLDPKRSSHPNWAPCRDEHSACSVGRT